jgi:hypothetical protein
VVDLAAGGTSFNAQPLEAALMYSAIARELR